MASQHDAYTLLDLAQEPIVVLDADGRFEYLNAAVENLLGFETDDLMGSDAFEIVHPADVHRIRGQFDRIVAHDGDTTRGDDTWGDTTRGDTTRGDTTRGDTTRGDHNRDVDISPDPSSAVTTADLGRHSDNVQSYRTDADAQTGIHHTEIAAKQKSLPGVEYRVRTADNSWIRLRTWLYPPAKTGLDGYVLSSRDVTQEVETRRRLHELAEHSGDVLWMFSADWDELLFVNDAAKEVFGVTPETLAQQPTAFLDHVHPKDRPRVKRAMQRLSDGKPTQLDYRVEPNTQHSRWVRVPADPIIEDGEVVRIAGFARDVSEEYKRNRQLTVMDNLLRHTIRNDMNVITGTADRIVDAAQSARDGTQDTHADGGVSVDSGPEPVPETVIDHAETIRRVGADLLETAEKQRDVIELLNRDAAASSLDVTDFVNAAVAEIRVACPDGRFRIESPQAARAETHPEIEYALIELLQNTVDHAETTPDVLVTIERREMAVEIVIRDSCPPIPREETLVVTDQREMTDLKHTTGMGLWLVYWVVDRSGGNLDFDVLPDGNEVTVSLPRAIDATAND